MSARLSWVLALIVVVTSGALMALLGAGDSASQSPVSVPAAAESARADALRADYPGGDRVPAIIVVTRKDGAALSAADVTAAGAGARVSEDGKAAVVVAPLPLSARPW